jgi:hypothetical protein
MSPAVIRTARTPSLDVAVVEFMEGADISALNVYGGNSQ